MPKTEWWEPYDGRLSRTVLREPGAATPPATHRAPRTQKEQPVEEMIGLFLMRCCAGDGGRSSVVALQEGATNHREVRRSRAVRAERYGKGVPLSASGVTQ